MIVVPPDPGCGAGTGNWPPTRNEAVSPDTAVRFGSASVFTSPFDSSACSSAVRLLAPPSGNTPLNAETGAFAKFGGVPKRFKVEPPILKLDAAGGPGVMPSSL